MLSCAWCMKKIKEDGPVYGLSITFTEGNDFSDRAGTITQVELETRHTSVPMVVAGSGSDAKRDGVDGIFAVCSSTCGKKMRDTLAKEKSIIKEVEEIPMG